MALALLALPLPLAGAAASGGAALGPVATHVFVEHFEPSWSPDGKRISGPQSRAAEPYRLCRPNCRWRRRVSCDAAADLEQDDEQHDDQDHCKNAADVHVCPLSGS
jgi:hypothetical protein